MTSAPQLTLFPEPVSSTDIIVAGQGRGAVFTRRWVVELILDLVGYRSEADLGRRVIVEPSCGVGAFLVPVVERLAESAMGHGHDLSKLGGAVRAFDLDEKSVQLARASVVDALVGTGVAPNLAGRLASQWITQNDFLLHDHDRQCADFVVGNPPYVRLEEVPPGVTAAYRAKCSTMRGRADLYVGFIECGLRLLKPGGTLSFICADRWMHNQYGGALREFISGSYSVDTVITMHDVDAFEDDVSAYPAIIAIENRLQAEVSVVDAQPTFDEHDARRLVDWKRTREEGSTIGDSFEATRVDQWFEGRDLWPSASPTDLALLADLEARFAPLENAATTTRVGIGVATGCDDVFITQNETLVEDDRLLPLLRSTDVVSGNATWSGRYLVNPWNESGLVHLADFPRLAAYFEANRDRLGARHIAKRQPSGWYRTIDRVRSDLTLRPKLVLPDMKATAHPVLSDVGYYPHHNLYYVTSGTWDLEVLGGLLLSEFANLFVGAYCVKMRGGTYRFQAQYLRRIRVPDPASIDRADGRALADAFRERDVERATGVAACLYGVDLSVG